MDTAKPFRDEIVEGARPSLESYCIVHLLIYNKNDKEDNVAPIETCTSKSLVLSIYISVLW